MRIKNILDYKKMTALFGFSRQSWNNWKKEKRPIVSLVEKYFTDQDIEEFLQTEKISKFEVINEFENLLLQSQADYLNFIYTNIHISIHYNIFTDFYHKLLVDIHNRETINNPVDMISNQENIDGIGYSMPLNVAEEMGAFEEDALTDEDISHGVNIDNYTPPRIWMLSDEIPGFILSNHKLIYNLNNHSKHILESGILELNNFDQNRSNYVKLNLSTFFKPLVKGNGGFAVLLSDDHTKRAVLHALLYTIYYEHPQLSYEDKIVLLEDVLKCKLDECTDSHIFYVHRNFDEYLKQIKLFPGF